MQCSACFEKPVGEPLQRSSLGLKGILDRGRPPRGAAPQIAASLLGSKPPWPVIRAGAERSRSGATAPRPAAAYPSPRASRLRGRAAPAVAVPRRHLPHRRHKAGRLTRHGL
jgi:hypothetical protein